MIIFPFASHLPRDVGLDLIPSYPSCCGSFLLPLVVENLFYLFFGHSYFLNTCNSGVPIGGIEFRVFLPCHLGHTLSVSTLVLTQGFFLDFHSMTHLVSFPFVVFAQPNMVATR